MHAMTDNELTAPGPEAPAGHCTQHAVHDQGCAHCHRAAVDLAVATGRPVPEFQDEDMQLRRDPDVDLAAMDAEDGAVERAVMDAIFATTTYKPTAGPDRANVQRIARAALDAAGVSALRAEIERLRGAYNNVPHIADEFVNRALSDASALADLRAGLQDLRTEVARLDMYGGLTALLAGPGGQPGQVRAHAPLPPDVAEDWSSPEDSVYDGEECGARGVHPAPVVPDSAASSTPDSEHDRGESPQVTRASEAPDTTDMRLSDLAEVHQVLDTLGAPQYAQAASRLLAVVSSGVTADTPEALRERIEASVRVHGVLAVRAALATFGLAVLPTGQVGSDG